MYRKGTLGAVFTAGEREHVRATLALAVNINPAYQVYKRIYQRGDFFGIVTKYTHLHTMRRIYLVFNRLFNRLKRYNRDYRAKLFFAVQLHLFINRVHNGRVKERGY